MTIHIVVDVDVLPGKMDEALAAFRALVPPTLAELGCSQFDVFRSEQEQDKLVLVETWADQQAIDSHMKEEHTARFLERVEMVFPHAPSPRRISPVKP